MKIKQSLLFILAVITGSCVYAQKQKFNIKGNVGGMVKSQKVYFTRIPLFASQQPVPVPVTVTNGQFTISGELEEPEQAIISLSENLRSRDSSFFFLVDAGESAIVIPTQISGAEVKGSKADAEFRKYIQVSAPLTTQFNQFYQELQRSASAAANQDSLQKIFQARYAEFQEAQKQLKKTYIKDNPESFINLFLLKELAEQSSDYLLADSLFQKLGSRIKTTPSGKLMASRIDEGKKFSIGAIAPDFTQPDVNGKPVKLSDFKGKYVLLDFWASWCGPCRQENPNVVEAYKKYKDKNFTVLGVSLDRENGKEAWHKAIREDKLDWTHVSDLKFWQNQAARQYNISSIPQNFLLDPSGKIIARNLRGEELQSFLAGIFARQ